MDETYLSEETFFDQVLQLSEHLSNGRWFALAEAALHSPAPAETVLSPSLYPSLQLGRLRSLKQELACTSAQKSRRGINMAVGSHGPCNTPSD